MSDSQPPETKKILPKDLTSYDLLKTFAIITMVCDHVGYFIFPSDMWLRMVGRLCVPVWFFLIGYAQSRDLGPKMWIGLAVMTASSFVAGMHVFPLNILATMIFLRLVLDPVMKAALKSESNLWSLSTMFALLALPTNGVAFEYGTLAMPLAMLGYMVRHKDELKNPNKILAQYFAFSYVLFIATQAVIFKPDNMQIMALCAGAFGVMSVLMAFRPATFPKMSAPLLRPLTAVLQFTGRHTLLIYVVHVLIFKAIGMWLEPHRFNFWHWTWLPRT